MGVVSEAQVGARQQLAPGSENAIRATPTGEIGSSDVHGRYHEAVRNGSVFIAANQTGVTTQAGLSATTPVLTLYNPAGSGYYASILTASIIFTVAFAAAALVWLAANTNIAAAAVTGTAAAVRNAMLGNAKNAQMSAFTAATLPAAPTAITVLGVGVTGAITTTPTELPLYRDVAGAICLYPGSAISFQTSAASGASAAFAELTWEEILI